MSGSFQLDVRGKIHDVDCMVAPHARPHTYTPSTLQEGYLVPQGGSESEVSPQKKFWITRKPWYLSHVASVSCFVTQLKVIVPDQSLCVA